MPQGAAIAEPNRRLPESIGVLVGALARSLTLFRMLAIVPYAWLFLHGGEASVAVLYTAVALSDWLDGKLARMAGRANARWGMLDAVADVGFNAASLAAAAWLGVVGPWVPLCVVLLGGRFLARALRTPPQASVVYDGTGNLAGVLYYALVGVIAAERWLGFPGAFTVARAGDLVFAYSVFAWFRKRSE